MTKKLQHEETGRMLDWPANKPIPKGFFPILDWYYDGFGLNVLAKLSKRFGKGWEDGVFHKGGIHTGTWILCGNDTGAQLRDILNLYASESEFLND